MTSDLTAESLETDPETTRLAHIRRESDVKSVGQLCYLVTFFAGLSTLLMLLIAVRVMPRSPELERMVGPALGLVIYWLLTFIYLLTTLGHAAVGYGLTHLQAWARWTVVVITGVGLALGTVASLVVCRSWPVYGLLGLVIGGAINGLILFPFITSTSGVIFSRDYKEIIRKTPQIRSRMNPLLKGLIGLILASILGFVFFLFAVSRRWIDI